MRFEPGSLVQLKSGGPAMTVVATDAESVHCVYFSEANDEIRTAIIPAVALDPVELADDDEEHDE